MLCGKNPVLRKKLLQANPQPSKTALHRSISMAREEKPQNLPSYDIKRILRLILETQENNMLHTIFRETVMLS